MKTKTILILACSVFTALFFGCKEEQLKPQTVIQSSEEITSQHISEEKTAITTAVTKTKTDPVKTEDPMNLLDTQAKIYTDIFGNLGGVEELQGIEGFMDLVKKMDATPETKKQLTEQYKLYSNSLDPKKKEELKAALLKAMKQ